MYKGYLEKKPSKKGGEGVFTTTTIPANVPICEFKGSIVSPPHSFKNREVLQIGPNSFLGPSGEIDDYINHSCNPNCYMHVVGNRAILYSLFVIPTDTEITFDYSTTSTDTPDKWQMDCNCRSYNCRGTISGFNTLDKSLQEEYKQNGLVPLYLTSNLIPE